MNDYLTALTAAFLLQPSRGTEYCDQPVCLSVIEHISGTAGAIGTKFCMQISCGRGRSSGGIALRYVLPVLWMTSCFAVVARMSMHILSVAKYSAPRGIARPGQSLMSMNALL